MADARTKMLLASTIMPKLLDFLEQDDQNPADPKSKIERFLTVNENLELFNEVVETLENQNESSSSATTSIHLGQGDSLSHEPEFMLVQESGDNFDRIQVVEEIHSRRSSTNHMHNHNPPNRNQRIRSSNGPQHPLRSQAVPSETISSKTQTTSNAQLSSSLTSSFVNSETVNDILYDLNCSDNCHDIIENIRRLAHLVKTDTGSDFFNEHIIIQMGSYLDHDNEAVNESALIFHAAILFSSLSNQFLYQAYENLITNINKIPNHDLDKIGALKRLRLVLDFFEQNFEMNQRNPTWFVADILENFMRLVCNYKIFALLGLFRYKWFDRFFLKAHFRKQILEHPVFKQDFLPMVQSMAALKFGPIFGPEEKNRDGSINGKLKTITVCSSLEILTTFRFYQTTNTTNSAADDELPNILCQHLSTDTNKTISKTSLICLKKLLSERDRVAVVYDQLEIPPKVREMLKRHQSFQTANLKVIPAEKSDENGNGFKKAVPSLTSDDFKSLARRGLSTKKFIAFYKSNFERSYVRNAYRNVNVSEVYDSVVYSPLMRNFENLHPKIFQELEKIQSGSEDVREFVEKFFSFVSKSLFS